MKKRYYYANGERVELNPSETMVAVKFKEDAHRGKCNDLIDKTDGTVNHESVEEVEELGFVLVPMDAQVEEASVSNARISLNKSSEVQEVLPVFESPEEQGAEYLVGTQNFIVQFKEGVSKERILELNREHKVEIVESDFLGHNSYLLRVVSGTKADAIDMANTYYELDETEIAEPEFAYPLDHLAPAVNDPYFSVQWALEKMNVPQAWNLTRGRDTIKIAILDEGVDIYHPDLRSKIVTPYDAVQNDNNQNPNAWDGHGTACAGIAAAATNNATGISGVAANCKIMPIRIAFSRNRNSGWFTTTKIIARGILQARLRGADVLSNSWGGGAYSDTIRRQFRDAKNLGRGGKGCVIICATGNDDVQYVSYPARYPECLACGASNQWDKRKSKTSQDGENWWGSNYGPEVDFVAPGVKIHTTDNRGSAGYTSGNYMATFNGTSSATPNAAGVAALVLSVDPNLKEWEASDIMKLTAKDINASGKDIYTGWGRVDALNAVKAAAKICFEQKMVLSFIGKNKECFMNFRYLRLSNCGINKIRLNSFTIKSNNSKGQAIDKFTYVGNPGAIMEAGISPSGGSGHYQQFNEVLLRAEGTKKKWRYNWKASWNYTFWRPSDSATSADAGLQPVNVELTMPLQSEYYDVEDSMSGENAGQGAQSFDELGFENWDNQEVLDLDSMDELSDRGVTISPNGDRSITIKF